MRQLTKENRQEYRQAEARSGSPIVSLPDAIHNLDSSWLYKLETASGRDIRWISWGYLIVVVFLWLAIRFGCDSWWPATILQFGPRGAVAVPLFFLAPWAAQQDKKLLLPLLAGGLIVLGPFMGWNIPPKAAVIAAEAKTLKVLTCNVEGHHGDIARLLAIVEKSKTDIVALQECPKCMAESYPKGWHSVSVGGQTIWSRYPLQLGKVVMAVHPDLKKPYTSLLSCIVQTPEGNLTFSNIHLPTARYGLMKFFSSTPLSKASGRDLLIEDTAARSQASLDVRQAVTAMPHPRIVVGDFNMTTDSAIYREHWGEYENAFSLAGVGYGWTQRAFVKGFKINIRVDHILTDKDFQCASCLVGEEIGADHLPVIAEIARGKSQS